MTALFGTLLFTLPPLAPGPSAPSEDAWSDPAGEIFVDPADRFDWEDQVGIVVALSYSPQFADAASVKLFGACLRVPRSLYLRVMRAALLRHMSEVDGVSVRSRLSELAWTLPPFGSWTASSPSREDDWLDPADEVFVDSSSALPWEEQVGVTPVQNIDTLLKLVYVYIYIYIYIYIYKYINI